MSDVVNVNAVKDALAECPICIEYFNDLSRIPRRMPCCSQAICEPCLVTYIKGRQKLSCPLCRQEHDLPGGVKSLPKEVVVLRFLDVLKTQRNAVPACADCPDNNSAMARCDNCSVYLCQPCLAAHARNRVTRQHRTTTFEEIQNMRSTRTSSAVPQKKPQDISKLTEKLDSMKQRMVTLSAAEENIDRSKRFAVSEINGCFDELVEELHQRRVILLSQVESKVDTVRKAIARAQESHKTSEQKLQKATASQQSSASVDALLKESPEDVEYGRLGVSFIPFSIQHLKDTIKAAGQVRTVDLRPTERPPGAPKIVYNAIQIQPDDYPQGYAKLGKMVVKGPVSKLDFSAYDTGMTILDIGVAMATKDMLVKQGLIPADILPDADKTISEGDGETICPHLEWDRNTASDDVTVSGTEIRNIKPVPPPPDTGCRVQSAGRVLASRPMVIRRGQRAMYHVRVTYSMKHVIPEDGFIFESVLTSFPIDANYNQPTGLSIHVSACPTHKQQLCLWVAFNNRWLTDIPLTRNHAGSAGDLQLGVLLDSNMKKIVPRHCSSPVPNCY